MSFLLGWLLLPLIGVALTLMVPVGKDSLVEDLQGVRVRNSVPSPTRTMPSNVRAARCARRSARNRHLDHSETWQVWLEQRVLGSLKRRFVPWPVDVGFKMIINYIM